MGLYGRLLFGHRTDLGLNLLYLDQPLRNRRTPVLTWKTGGWHAFSANRLGRFRSLVLNQWRRNHNHFQGTSDHHGNREMRVWGIGLETIQRYPQDHTELEH